MMNKLFSELVRLLACFLLLFAVQACSKNVEPPSEPIQEYYHHQVRYQGETLGLISNWYTGQTSNWMLIQEHNPGLDVRRMRKGDVILIPKELIQREEPLPVKTVTRFNSNSGSKKVVGVHLGSKSVSEKTLIKPGTAKPNSDQELELKLFREREELGSKK